LRCISPRSGIRSDRYRSWHLNEAPSVAWQRDFAIACVALSFLDRDGQLVAELAYGLIEGGAASFTHRTVMGRRPRCAHEQMVFGVALTTGATQAASLSALSLGCMSSQSYVRHGAGYAAS